MTLHEPVPRRSRLHHRKECEPPGLVFSGVWPAMHTVPYGSLWECECGRWYHASKHSPILPWWDRVPAFWARKVAARRKARVVRQRATFGV